MKLIALVIALAVIGTCEAKGGGGGGGGHASSGGHSSSGGAHSTPVAPAKVAPVPARPTSPTAPAHTSWWPFGGGTHTSCNKEKDKNCR